MAGEPDASSPQLAMDPRELLRRQELLEHEAAEIAAGGLRPGEAAEITAQLAAAQHAETIASGAVDVRDVLLGEGRGARERIAAAEAELRAIARLDGRWAALADRLAGLEAEVEDVAAEVRVLAETVDHDPSTLQALEDGWARSTGCSAAMATTRRRSSSTASGARRRPPACGASRTSARAGPTRTAGCCSRVADAAARCRCSGPGPRASSAAPCPRCWRSSAFRPTRSRWRWDAGRPPVTTPRSRWTATRSRSTPRHRHVVFQFRPNAGEPARPLARIASGGELSRVALAIKQVLAEVDATPTLVFDEIDTGIGGRSADPVGRSLWTLAREHQVLCVTHLPQIAAYADAHYRIAKLERDGRTVTEIVRLDRSGGSASWPR